MWPGIMTAKLPSSSATRSPILVGSTMLPHTTGLWCRLRQEVYKEFEVLRDGDPEFYFVQHLGDGKDGHNIEDEFQLNAIVEDTPTKAKKREISLGIKIKGQFKLKS
ncbi:hypothetical protein BC936DRAFT_136675 [Jimgerdemannia flammicorona]|uniref:Uncharacterized protein n=1 Tax=Jimgerdemannia flammicorona TaxID=994334 RepID=A0A433DJF6_9FUNG|nr:hypothetical protein BC936DRAFT_136675 [Jimgerdemannia flammicorona]